MTSRARQQQAKIKASPAAKDAGDGEETGGGASPLKLYLGQILLAAANLSSAAHTNHSSGSIRASGASPGGEVVGFHLLGLMLAEHKEALREASEVLKLQEAHFTWVRQQREGAWCCLTALVLVMFACPKSSQLCSRLEGDEFGLNLFIAPGFIPTSGPRRFQAAALQPTQGGMSAFQRDGRSLHFL